MSHDAKSRIRVAVFLEQWFASYARLHVENTPAPGPERAVWHCEQNKLWPGFRNLSRHLAELLDREFSDPPSLDSTPLWEIAGTASIADLPDRAWKAAWIVASKMGAKVGAVEQAKADYMIALTRENQAATAGKLTTTTGKSAALSGVAPRNLWFLDQYEAIGTDTYHKQKAIATKWWEKLTQAERVAICPDYPGKATRATVVTGIKRAREQRDGKPKAKPKRKQRPRKA